jgi:hypothetical protein
MMTLREAGPNGTWPACLLDRGLIYFADPERETTEVIQRKLFMAWFLIQHKYTYNGVA